MARTRKPPKRHESAETEEPSPSDKEQEDRAPSAGKGEPLDLEQIEIPDDNWEVPDPEEWANQYRKYKSFKLPGSDQNYTTGDFVFIMPDTEENKRVAKRRKTDTADDNPWWIGKVKEVRAKDVKNVWMVICWMFTTIAQLEDVGARKIPKDPLHREVFLSDHEDLLPVHVVADLANVKVFDESDATADPLDAHALWYRSQLLKGKEKPTGESSLKKSKKRKRRLTASRSKASAQPVITPLRPPSCICKRPYHPHPHDRDPMVYCPADSCRRWYHTGCLKLAGNAIAKASAKDIERLSTSGSALFPSDLPGTGYTISKPVQTIPKSIRNAASSSIIRGTTATGIVGNGQKVLRARKILELSTKNSGEEMEDEELQFSIQVWQEKAVSVGQEASSTHWTCLECSAVI